MTPLTGVLCLVKPVGPTSHDIVAAARRALGVQRVGHAGTLDPFASGLLLLCIGPATRLAEYLSDLPKRYTATLRLGTATDTDDLNGVPLSRSDGWREVDADALHAALDRQRGRIDQVPPQYSAKKVGGRRMYDVARSGESIDLAPVAVEVTRLDLLRYEPPDAVIDVTVSSGTYIRAIARDVGAALGTGAHLTELVRTEIGPFTLEQALPIEALGDGERVRERLLTPARALAHLPTMRLNEAETARVRHGGAVAAREGVGEVGGPVSLLDPAGSLLAVGMLQDGVVRPRKVLG